MILSGASFKLRYKNNLFFVTQFNIISPITDRILPEIKTTKNKDIFPNDTEVARAKKFEVKLNHDTVHLPFLFF